MAQKRKTQQEVLTELVKKLGYASYNDLPVRSFLEDKLLNGTLTVRESVVLDFYARGIKLQPATQATPIGKVFAEMFPPENKIMPGESPSPGTISNRANVVLNSTQKAGFTLDTPFKDISNSREAMEKIAKHTASIDPGWSGVFNSLKGTHTLVTDDAAFLYQNPKEKAAGLASAKQSRGSKSFKGIPPAKQAFPEIVAGLSTVEDTSTANALIASSLAPYRPGEVADLRLGAYDLSTIEVDRPPGYFDIEKGAIIFPVGTTGNKTATDLILDKNSILYQTLALQAVEAQSLGSDNLFPDVTTQKMTNAIRENITPRMEQFEGILGRPFDEAKDFRKIIYTMIVSELGYPEEAEKMLGHTDAQLNAAIGKVGNKHYLSTIVRTDNPLAAVQLSFESMIGEAIGASTLNETATAMGLDIPGFTDKDASPIKVVRRGEQLSEKTVVEPRQMTTEELASLESRRELVTAENKKAAQDITKKALAQEEENIAKAEQLQAERQKLAETRAEAKSKTPSVTPLSEEDQAKFKDGLKKLGINLTKALGPILPTVGAVFLAEEIQADIKKGEGILGTSPEVSTGLRTAKFAAELTPPGAVIPLAEMGAKATAEEGTELLERSYDMDQDELLQSFGEFGARTRGY